MASSFAPCPAHVHWDERCHEHQWATIVAVLGQLSEKVAKMNKKMGTLQPAEPSDSQPCGDEDDRALCKTLTGSGGS